MPKYYGWVREIVPESPADLAGIVPGDLIHAINGKPLRDLVDYHFLIADDDLTLEVRRQETPLALTVTKTPDQDLGILFGEEPAPFIRGCANKCVFCFIDGLPKHHTAQRGLPLGMRDSLYIKDDDYRYSFLFGNFITLTNLKEHDWQRLAEQRLTPLFVSVHTTEPTLRRKMVAGPRAGEIIDHIQRLGDLGIQVHTQLVLCPEMNDGAELDRSIADLAALRPTVLSISAVPVGLTKYNSMIKVDGLPGLRPFRRDESEAIVQQVRTWQRRFERESDAPFVYLSDEWYFLTEHAFPRSAHYGDFAQVDNGVGMTRRHLDRWGRARRRLPRAIPDPVDLTIVTATMAQGIMADLVADLNTITGMQARLLPVVNRFFGPLVTVAGLLTGQDILDALAEQKIAAPPPAGARRIVLLPKIVLDNAATQFLDDIALADFQERAADQVIFAKDAGEILELVEALATNTLPADPVIVGGK